MFDLTHLPPFGLSEVEAAPELVEGRSSSTVRQAQSERYEELVLLALEK